MKTITSLAFVAFLGLLASCTINPHPMDMTQAVQAAKTRSDHEALAKHYDEAANEMEAKAAEHKQLAAQYAANKNIGKHTRTLISHCQGLARAYEEAAAENRSMAESHRQLASEAK
jgi:hypothetical protein